jgi:hypothetical protein
MGLEVVVGYAASLEVDESGELQTYVDEIGAVRRALLDAELPAWEEPLQLNADFDGYEMLGYSGLHYLRRIAAYLADGRELPPPGDEDAPEDPVLMAAYERGPRHALIVDGPLETIGEPGDAAGAFDHLLHHNDAEGFYVPIDVAPVLIDPRVVGIAVGSSYRLRDECLELAARLGIPDNLEPDDELLLDAVDGKLAAPVGWQEYPVESFVCVGLLHAAQRSIDSGTAAVFC